MQVFGDDGARIDVRVDGSGGTPIVLIAGFPLTRDVWQTQAATLGRAHRAIRPDVRGMGNSAVSDGPYLMEALAGDVAATLDALGIERAAIVGHSLGGYVALSFARMYAERVSHLALVCSRLSADTPERAAARRELADRIEAARTIEPLLDAYLPGLLSAPSRAERPDVVARAGEIARRTDPVAAAALLRGMAMRSPSDDFAADLDVPVLAIGGALDALVPVEETRAIAAAFPRGRALILERSGHLPMLEEPDATGDALAAFVSE